MNSGFFFVTLIVRCIRPTSSTGSPQLTRFLGLGKTGVKRGPR